ncbi:MAG: HAMP domain-containing histidine kinase [Synergistaceae bacterium]|jgi:signal transduction histidine kinase|nr:HAMP domain-containing histidine kinase [Synergistaceae bacterium]
MRALIRLDLKSKLTLSYVLVAALLAASLLFMSKYFLEKQFMVYISHKQDMKNEEILEAVTRAFSDDGTLRDSSLMAFLTDLGNSLQEQGVALMVYGREGEMVYCTSSGGESDCAHLAGHGAIPGNDPCPDFSEAYTQKRYEIKRDGSPLGYMILGYHGAFYYNEGDRVFLKEFNRAFLVMTIIFFAAAAGVGLFMAGRIATPIKKVTERTKRIAEGEYSERVDMATGTAEIDDLSAGVDHLADSLQTQFMLKKRMAHAYSHEFRTPLAALQSNIEAMIDGLWSPTAERLQSLLAEIFRLSRMVSEVEDLVQVQVKSDADGAQKRPADISEMTELVLQSFESGLRQKGINLSYERSRCEAAIDSDKFSQVIFNLVSNAVKYTDRGGNIKVRTFEGDGKAVFSIEDDGIGISGSDLPHIFEYLYRADESRARGTGGNGIGLSVVKAVVDAHGGTIEVDSAPGRGSVFIVALPAA